MGASLISSFWGKSKQVTDSSVAQTSIAAGSPQSYDDMAAIDGFGGPGDAMLPRLTGVSNQSNRYGRLPLNLGKNQVYPIKSVEPVSEVYGNEEYLYAAFDFGYGEQEITEIKIGGRPLSEFPSVTTEIRAGVAGDTAIAINKIGAFKSFSHDLEPGVGVTEEAPREGQSFYFDLFFPNGFYHVTYNQFFPSGYKENAILDIKIWIRPLGGSYSLLTTHRINNLSTVPWRAFIPIAHVQGRYEFKLERVTPYDTTGNTVDRCTWTKLQVTQPGNPFGTMKDSQGVIVPPARLGITARSTNELQGTFEQLSAIVKSKVPIYNAETETWSAPTYSSNPAWLALKVLKGQCNYKPLTDDQIHLQSFVDWAKHNDDNGITYNRNIDSETTPRAVLKELFAIGRAKDVLKDGKYGVIIDRAQTQVVQHFSPRNSWGFHWQATRGETPDKYRILFINPDKDWQQDERIVYKDGKDATNALTSQSVQLQGCTSSDQAFKYGKFLAADDMARRRTYQWYAYLDAIICQRGDLVRVTNPLIGAGTGQGRIKSVAVDGSGNVLSVTIDSRVQMIDGTNYKVRIRPSLAPGESIVASVVTVAGNQSVLAFSTPLAHDAAVLPAVNDLLLFGEQPEESRELIITNIEWTENFTALISAKDHAPGIYKADTEPVPEFVSNIQRRHPLKPDVPVPVILDIKSDETVLEQDSDGAYKTRIVLYMQVAPRNVQFFEVQYQRAGSTLWSNSQATNANAGIIKIEGPEDGLTYNIRVRARSFDFWTSDWNVSITDYLCIGKTTPPPDLPPLELDPETGDPRVFADRDHGYDVPRDFAGIQWRMHWGDNSDWETATIVGNLVTGSTINIKKYAKGLKTFLAKAVDVAGNMSVTASVIVKDFGDPIPDNIIETFDYGPAFPGIKTNCSIDDGYLKADDATLFYKGGSSRFWKGQAAALFWSSSYSEMVYEFEYKPDSAVILKPFKIKLALDIDSSAYKVEYSLAGNTYFWDRNPLGATRKFWTGAANKFYQGQDNWLPMPETGLDGIYGRYKFRITCYASRYRSVLRQVSLIVDVPDVIRRFNNLVITNASDGIVVPVVPGDFRVIKYISPSLVKDVAHPDALVPEPQDDAITGPLIKMKNASNAFTTGKFSVEIGGY